VPASPCAQKDVAAELAELDVLRWLTPFLEQQIQQADEDVQRKNQLLQERVMERVQLEQHVEHLYGRDALGTGGTAAPPYSLKLLEDLAREYAEVQELRQEVRQRYCRIGLSRPVLPLCAARVCAVCMRFWSLYHLLGC